RSGGDYSDQELLRRFAANRDEAAFGALVARHGSMVLGVCRRLLRHRQDAEDAFQAAFLVLARKAASVPWRLSIANWLYAVAYRVSLKAKSQRARQCVPSLENPEEVPMPGDFRVEVDQRELCQILDEELCR